ncbi:MAG: glycosyltransferase [Bacteroidota bacterium]
MKILAVDQTGVLAADRGLWRALNGADACTVVLVVPESWPEGGMTLQYETEASRLKVIPARALFAGKSHRAFYPSLGSVVASEKPDILYVNAEPESFLAWQAARIKQKSPQMKLVFMSWRNIDYPPGEFPYKLPLLNALAERTTLRYADHCIAHNQSAKEIFQRKGFKGITVIPPPVDTAMFNPSHYSTTPSLHQKVFTVGFIGRLSYEKNIDLLLHAVAGLTLDYQLHLVGDGPAKTGLQRLASSLGIAGRITWTGPVLHSRVAEQLRAMHVLVLPSRTTKYWKEQFGRILIEAMACGVAVVGSDSGEIPNVIGDARLIFKEGDEEGLRTHLITLADENVRNGFVQKGFERVSKIYNLGVIAGQWLRVFKTVRA